MANTVLHDEHEVELIKKVGLYGASFPSKILDWNWLQKLVCRPTYIVDNATGIRIEKDPPSIAEYISLGYDPTVDSGVRHWRYYVKKELENCSEIMTPSPFSTFQLTRGLSASLFHARKNDVPEMMDVGVFKGWVNIKLSEDGEDIKEDEPLIKSIKDKVKTLPEGSQKLIKPYVDLYSSLKIDSVYKGIAEEISIKSKCVVRLYVIEAFNLSSRDLTSPSDPYLYITLGDKVIDEREKHQDDIENPKFYSKYEFVVDLVSTPLLNIKVYDYDYIGKDLIGETTINLDDRYFSPFWRALPEKPIEERSLYSEETSTERGRIRVWVDIFKVTEEKPAWNISPQPDAVSNL